MIVFYKNYDKQCVHIYTYKKLSEDFPEVHYSLGDKYLIFYFHTNLKVIQSE